jgi:hypothetical protein
MTRRSLRDRNRAAIALDPDTPDLEPTAEPRSSAQPTATRPVEEPAHAPQKATSATEKGSTTKKPAAVRKAATAAASDTARLGIYLTPQEFEDAKAAYLADWTNGGEADTFARWIAAAIETYAARTKNDGSLPTPPPRLPNRLVR